MTDFEALYKNQLADNAALKTRIANLVYENKKLKERLFNLERDASFADTHNQEAYEYEV